MPTRHAAEVAAICPCIPAVSIYEANSVLCLVLAQYRPPALCAHLSPLPTALQALRPAANAASGVVLWTYCGLGLYAGEMDACC